MSILLITIILNWRVHCRSITNLHVAHSCIVHLILILSALLQMTVYIPRIFQSSLPEPSIILCRALGTFSYFSIGIVANGHLIQAMSRFFMTIFYKNKFLSSFTMNWILIVIGWFNSILISFSLLISSEAYQYESESHICAFTSKSFLTAMIISIASIIVALLTMTILYSSIIYHSVKQTHIDPNSLSARRARRTRQIFKNTFVFVGILGIAGLPYFICVIWNKVHHAPEWLYEIAYLCSFIGTALNSIVLFITSKQIRNILFMNLFQQEFTQKTNRIVPFQIQTKTPNTLPVIS